MRTKHPCGERHDRLSSRAGFDGVGSTARTFAKLKSLRTSSPRVALVLIALILITLRAHSVSGQTPFPSSPVRIGVLGLFHPRELKVTAPTGTALILRTATEQITLERSSGANAASIRVSEDGVLIAAGARTIRAPSLTLTGRENNPVDFVLSVPGKLTRRYHGTLEIKPSAGRLLAIVTMDLETAVASVVAAESAPETPLEALKAQAVATRRRPPAPSGLRFLRHDPLPVPARAAAARESRGQSRRRHARHDPRL